MDLMLQLLEPTVGSTLSLSLARAETASCRGQCHIPNGPNGLECTGAGLAAASLGDT